MAERGIQKVVGNLFILMAYIAAATCLLRSDFNFAFSLFFYYIWIIKREPETLYFILVGLFLLTVFDIFWFLNVGGYWITNLPVHLIWQEFSTSHLIVIALSGVNVFVKVILAFLISQSPKNNDMSQAMFAKNAFP